MVEEKLKPCPFCGAPARVIYDTHYETYGVVCDSKDKNSLCRGAIWPHFGEPKLAIEAWNKRRGKNRNMVYRQHAHWVCLGGHHTCSRCEYTIFSPRGHEWEFRFCPKCGADMRDKKGEVRFEDWEIRRKDENRN